MKAIHGLRYVIARAFKGMRQSFSVQLLAVGTMAVCMLLLGTATLIFFNARQVSESWGIDVPLTVYMSEEASPEFGLALAQRIEALEGVESARFIEGATALERVREGLGEGREGAPLLEGIEAELFPESIELSVSRKLEPERVAAISTHIEALPEVDEVVALGPWMQEARTLVETLKALAIGVGVLVALACMAIVWNTVRLGVFARRAELQILRLVGGSAAFVRGPFLVEGILQGLLGMALALTGLYFAFDFVRPLLREGLSVLFASGTLHFFSPLQIGIALAFGAFVGMVASRVAVARYVEI